MGARGGSHQRCCLSSFAARRAPVAIGQLTALRIEDYATMPMTGIVDGTNNNAYLARVNFLAEEPGGGNRFFVNDLNGPLYMLDRTTKQFTSYLNFNGRGSATGLFDKFVFSSGFANGLITFQFDPDYGNNGKFYTVHMEEPGAAGSQIPNNATVPGFNTAGYTTTSAVTTPGGGARQTVLVEWTDTNIDNSTFEGTARELLRLDMSGQIHPMGDLIFNPLADPGDPDWRVMYISIGDGGAGEQGNAATRMTPQRLDTLGGKDPADYSRPDRAHRYKHGQSQRPVPHSQRQSLTRRSITVPCAMSCSPSGCAIPTA